MSFVSAAILKIKREWGDFTAKLILDIETIYKISACDLLRRSNFFFLQFWKFSETFNVT